MTGLRLTHVQLQAAVEELLTMTGWSWLHVRRSIGKGHRWTTTTNVVGWPDLFCWSPRQPGRFLAIEVKVPPDKLKPEQRACLDELGSAGVETLVVTEAELDSLPSVLRPKRN